MNGDTSAFNPLDASTSEAGYAALSTALQQQQQQQHAPSFARYDGMNGYGQQASTPAAINGFGHHQQQMMMNDPSLNNSLSSMSVPDDLEHSFSSITAEDAPQNRYSGNAANAQQALQSSTTTATNTPNAVSVTATPQYHQSDEGDNKKPAPAPAAVAARPPDDDDDVIEILDDDDDNDNADAQQKPKSAAAAPPPSKRARYVTNTGAVAIMPPSIGMTASYANRTSWMVNNPMTAAGNAINPGQTLSGYNNPYAAAYGGGGGGGGGSTYGYAQPQQYASSNLGTMPSSFDPSKFDIPQYQDFPSQFVPTWKTLIPDEMLAPPKQRTGGQKAYRLSLAGVSEFTITGLQPYYDAPPTPLAGLRPAIKRISREHGQATFEKDPSGVGGRWKIPLGAYHAFVAYLQSDPECVRLETIPQMQLKIASLGKARMERDYPSAEKLMQRGVPFALANTLAPFQRGGVDFVLERDGRALIADEMGLGKTIQSIASMSVYHKEWPLLVLTPSGARYHWEAEFRNWLGVNGAAVKKAEEMADQKKQQKASSASILMGRDKTFSLLRDQQIHVLTSSKVKVLPNKGVRIVICSYGLAPMLAQNRQIIPGMFGCAIADESHMMKNSKSKRTQSLLPILKACRRCVLLSGTPALAKPAELWPQLQILASDKGYWDNEADFIDKYVKNGNTDRRAELHAMLTGTLMIRRLKDNILKDMPRKAREKAIIKVESSEMRKKMQECMQLLRQGKGVLGKLARQHSAIAASALEEEPPEEEEETVPTSHNHNGPSREQTAQSFQQLLNGQRHINMASPAEAALEQEMLSRYQQSQLTLQHTIQTSAHQLNQAEISNFIRQRDYTTRNELQVEYQERLHGMLATQNGGNGMSAQQQQEDEKPTRATVLNKMYSLTGECKIPLVSKFLLQWLHDNTKGKICVFAHHITVLDAIAEEVGLCNSGKQGTHQYIRIDGKTSPKSRQEQIDSFQNDATVRVALLGITAAGVAVTLTAASQVLFAELFWTPALMIQAEDRCHRIGQRARVHCKYLVATGTLDDILWKLIEKKFRELGEFVEGKEKLKMIVHKVYKNEEELFTIFDYDDEEGDDDDDALQEDQVDSGETGLIPLDMDLEQDIAELGREEQAMVLGDKEDDEELDPTTSFQEAYTAPVTTTVVQQEGPGRSEEDAIALSDDEEEVVDATPLAVDLKKPGSDLNTGGALPSCRIYKLLLKGDSLGCEIGLYKDRLVVARRLPPRLARLGEYCKPHVGEILVAVDERIMPPIQKLEPALKWLKKIISKPHPATLWFVEDADFQEFYKNVCPPSKRKPKPKPAPPPDDVVELLDD